MNEAQRQHLARDMAFQLACKDPACLGRHQWWSAVEHAHAQARSGRAAAAAAAPAMALCVGCDCQRLCADLAEVGRYTGLAAGAAYHDGERRTTGRAGTGRPALRDAS